MGIHIFQLATCREVFSGDVIESGVTPRFALSLGYFNMDPRRVEIACEKPLKTPTRHAIWKILILNIFLFLLVPQWARAETSRGEAVWALPDGRAVMASTITEGKRTDIFLVFFSSRGDIEKQTVQTIGKPVGIYGMAVEGENIFLAGYSQKGRRRMALLTRHHADGTLEGFTETELGDSAESHFLSLDRTGRPVVTGFYRDRRGEYPFTLRYRASGSVESSFEKTGWQGRAYGVALQPDGKIIIGGTRHLPGRRGEAVVFRYLPDGRLDIAFGEGGTATLLSWGKEQGALQDVASSIAVEKGGKIVAAGFSRNRKRRTDIFVTRLLPDGAPDPAFHGTKPLKNVFLLDFYRGRDIAHAVLALPSGEIFAAGEVSRKPGRMAWLRLRPDGKLKTFAVVPVGKPGQNVSAEAAALRKDGGFLLTGYAKNNWTLCHFSERGNLETRAGD